MTRSRAAASTASSTDASEGVNCEEETLIHLVVTGLEQALQLDEQIQEETHSWLLLIPARNNDHIWEQASVPTAPSLGLLISPVLPSEKLWEVGGATGYSQL